MPKQRTLVNIHVEIMKLVSEREEIIRSRLNGRTQTYIANKAGISPQRFNNWLNASSELDEGEISLVTDVLNS